MSDGPSNGLAVIDKPPGWTSHDVVARSRGLLGTRKVGHAGTLDPMATGVLVIGVGPSTRLLTFLSGLPKVYEATIRFGTETDTLDADGRVIVTHDTAPPAPADVRVAAGALTGDLMQVPPMVSAVKVGGRRLHELAREGKEVEREPRPVTVHRFDTAPTDDPMEFTAVVACSSGTFVRVLAADLGHALGGGAHLTALRRTAVGPFTIDEAQAFPPEPGPEGAALPLAVLAPAALARVMASVEVDAATAREVAHGRVLERDRLGKARGAGAGDGADGEDGPWAVLSESGELLAVYRRHRGTTVKPALVMAH